MNANAAAHEFNNFPRDGETQTGAAEFAGRRGVRLHEWLEQQIRLLARQTNASVGDLKPEFDATLRVCDRLHPNDDFAAFGKFNAVGDEVQQHLPQPDWITHQAVRHVAANDGGEVNFLIRIASRSIFENAVHDVAQGKIFLHDIHFTRFNLGEIKNVVDDVEQRIGARSGGGGEFLLPRVEARLRKQFNHAENAAQRRANLVTHVREKFALGGIGTVGLLGGGIGFLRGNLKLEIGFFQRGLGFLQRKFGLLARSDVLDDDLILKTFTTVFGEPAEITLLPLHMAGGGYGATIE